MANIDTISTVEPTPGLFISGITATHSPDTLRKHGITHVLSLTNQQELPRFAKELGIQQLHLDIEDNPYEDLLMSLDGICAWIDNALSLAKDRGTGVLVHCLEGVSRSGAVIIAYLMRTRSISYEAAFDLARKSRAVIIPNSGFADQLRVWQQMGYSIYKNGCESSGQNNALETAQVYEDWRANRGILMSRAQEAKEQETRKRMADIAARFGRRRFEFIETDEAEIITASSASTV
ncbi:hypothetical protein V496_09609 [Pseudogymnoascus sp. VKM F-4515 (FW-2607)]|nr:hypothetical protein V496_09609 [Pseudogymnoascus sp. VKM F-4515 (FW-2607)]KFY88309.1 hypothetical protein V498_06834 [Pseudogymnoascus sp. VKM F-4517 (FW-2822)]